MTAKLRKKAIFFYKMAQQLNLPFHEDVFKTKLSQKEADYHEWISRLSILNGEEFLTGFEYFWDEPYFNRKLVIEVFMKHLFGLSKIFGNIIASLSGNNILIDNWKLKQLRIEAIKYFIDHSVNDLTITDYLKYIEPNNDLPISYLRKAQLELVKWIYENAIENFDNSTDALLELLKKSIKFNKDFLLRVAKHLGPEYYSIVATQYYPYVNNEENTYKPSPQRQETILNKEKLNMYDVAELLEFNHSTKFLFTKEFFLKIINKSDPEAKEYLRKFLYTSDDGIQFILDETMRPMNKDYKPMNFPPKFQIFRNWQTINPLHTVWQPIFEEFQIVPISYDHWN